MRRGREIEPSCRFRPSAGEDERDTVGDYYRMAEVGILRPDERVELIEGEIIEMPPIGSRHAGTVEQLGEALRAAAGDRGMVRIRNPRRLGEHSEPQPDIALVRLRRDYYKSSHPGPGDVLLVVEVGVASIGYGRDVKVPLYARFSVPEVWLIDVERLLVARYREPRRGAYGRVDLPGGEAPIRLEAARRVS